MWLFYAYSNGYIPMGIDGQMHTNSKNIKKVADAFRNNRPGVVYAIANWTQAMSELSPRAFEEYVARNGKVVSHS